MLSTGGLEVDLRLEELWDVLISSKVAESVRVRLLDPQNHKQCSLRAPTYERLEGIITEKSRTGSYREDLETFLPLKRRGGPEKKGGALAIQSTASKSALFHSTGITQRLEKYLWKMKLLRATDHLIMSLEKLNDFASTKKTGAVPRFPLAHHKGEEAEDKIKEDEKIEKKRDESEWETRLYARLEEDNLELSISASGERLHKRGFRTDVVPGSIRETLAAACLQIAEYDPLQDVLWDPFCGSGTFLLEAITSHDENGPTASNILHPERSFSCELWAWHPDKAFAEHKSKKRSLTSKRLSSRLEFSPTRSSATTTSSTTSGVNHPLPPSHPPRPLFFGSDLSPKALAATRSNILSLQQHLFPHKQQTGQGIASNVILACGDFETVGNDWLAGPFARKKPLVLANLPYGKQVEGEALLLRRWTRFTTLNFPRFRGVYSLFPSDPSSVSLLAASSRSTPFVWRPVASFANGGISVNLNRLEPRPPSS